MSHIRNHTQHDMNIPRQNVIQCPKLSRLYHAILGPNGAHLSFPGHALLDRAKAPRLGLLTGREFDRSTGACHELHSNNVQRKTEATTHEKMSAPAELQLARQCTQYGTELV